MTLRQDVSLKAIRTARRFAGNGRLAELPFVVPVYTAVARWASAGRTEVRFRGLDLAAPRPDGDLFPGLVGGYYERLQLDLFERLAADCRTVVDVGGNIGVYACAAARALPPDGRVVAYEPVAENAHHLRRNVERNHPRAQVLVEECAVGDVSGQARLHLSASIGSHSMAPANSGDPRGSVPVGVVTLDDHLPAIGADTPDLIKIDVKGFEVHVLRGARRILARARPTLFVELPPDQLAACGTAPHDLIELLAETHHAFFLIDERRQTLRPCAAEDLLPMAGRRLLFGLVAAARAEHIEVISAACTGPDASPRPVCDAPVRRLAEGARSNR